VAIDGAWSVTSLGVGGGKRFLSNGPYGDGGTSVTG
jgi:hypothetical protein